MSRHVVNRSPETVAGWDPPLGNYFCHVYDEDGDLQASAESRNSAAAVLLLASGHGATPERVAEVHQLLLADRAEPWEPGPLQKMLGFDGTPKSVWDDFIAPEDREEGDPPVGDEHDPEPLHGPPDPDLHRDMRRGK